MGVLLFEVRIWLATTLLVFPTQAVEPVCSYDLYIHMFTCMYWRIRALKTQTEIHLGLLQSLCLTQKLFTCSFHEVPTCGQVVGNAVLGGAGGDGGDGNGNTANGGDFNSGNFSGNGGIAIGDNGNGGAGGNAIGGESSHYAWSV